jgi:hypothetical protein
LKSPISCRCILQPLFFHQNQTLESVRLSACNAVCSATYVFLSYPHGYVRWLARTCQKDEWAPPCNFLPPTIPVTRAMYRILMRYR